jgi:hypothetical protein
MKVFFNDHGHNHLRAVLDNARCLAMASYQSIPFTEQALLCAAIWLHDIGLFAHPPGEDELTVRRLHADRSAEYVRLLQSSNPDVISRQLADMLSEVCRAHRRDFDLTRFSVGPRLPEVPGQSMRGDLIAALLRIADAADVGQGRTPAALYAAWKETIPNESRAHWEAHSLVHASSVNARTAEIVLHLLPEADTADPDLADLTVATVEDLDSTRRILDQYGLRPWTVRFEQSGKYISPAAVYGRWGH